MCALHAHGTTPQCSKSQYGMLSMYQRQASLGPPAEAPPDRRLRAASVIKHSLSTAAAGVTVQTRRTFATLPSSPVPSSYSS